jgi:hypothetical protein
LVSGLLAVMCVISHSLITMLCRNISAFIWV